jgi:hypothetical protein
MIYIAGKRWVTIIQIYIKIGVNIHTTVLLSNIVDPKCQNAQG